MNQWFRICLLGWCFAGVLAQAAPSTALVFSPDGKSLLSNGHASIHVHSLADGQIKEKIPSSVRRISSFAISPSGEWLAVAGGEPGSRGELAIMAWASRRIVYQTTNATDINTRVAFNHDGQLAATSSADHKATIYRISKNGLPSNPIILTGHTGPILAIAFDPTTSNLVTGGADRSLKVWSQEGKLLRTMSYHTEAVNALAFRPITEGRHSECASGSEDGSIRIWQPEIGRMVRIVRNPTGSILALVYHPDGSTLFSTDKEGSIKQIEASSDQTTFTTHTKQDWPYRVTINSVGNKLATGDSAGRVRLWKLPLQGMYKNHDLP